MTFFRNITIATMMVAGLAVGAFGQKGDPKTPPKGSPPVIKPQPKPPPPEKKGGRGESAFVVWVRDDQVIT